MRAKQHPRGCPKTLSHRPVKGVLLASRTPLGQRTATARRPPSPDVYRTSSGIRRRRRNRGPAAGRGFSLVELLVVVAFAAALAAGVGLALVRPDETVSLQGAQETLAGLCRAARTRAALAGQNCRLIVGADPAAPECLLRYVQVVREDPAAAGHWLADDAGVTLPRGICVVPPVVAAVPGNSAWPAGRRSTALAATAQAMTINGVSAGLFYYVAFTPRGTTGGGNVVVTTACTKATRAGDTLVCASPDQVRGVLLRAAGSLTLLDDPGAFAP